MPLFRHPRGRPDKSSRMAVSEIIENVLSNAIKYGQRKSRDYFDIDKPNWPKYLFATTASAFDD